MPPIYKYTKILKQYINPDELPNMNIYDHPEYPDSPQMENDSFELGKLQEVPEYPYHYLMVEKMPNLTTLLLVWAKMDRHLREYTVAVWRPLTSWFPHYFSKILRQLQITTKKHCVLVLWYCHQNYQRKFFLLTGQNKYKETCSSIITSKTGRQCSTSYMTKIGCMQKQWHLNHQHSTPCQLVNFLMPMLKNLEYVCSIFQKLSRLLMFKGHYHMDWTP